MKQEHNPQPSYINHNYKIGPFPKVEFIGTSVVPNTNTELLFVCDEKDEKDQRNQLNQTQPISTKNLATLSAHNKNIQIDTDGTHVYISDKKELAYKNKIHKNKKYQDLQINCPVY